MILLQSVPNYDPDIAREFGGSGNYEFTSQLFGIPLFEADSFWQLIIRFFFNFLVCWCIIRFFYYNKSQRKDYYFTFILFSVTIFLLIFLLDNVKLQIGFALGLFAIFGMIRYRTETVPIREMTYLFEIIGISVINGLAMTVSYAELIITNLIFIAATWIFENNKYLKHNSTKIILYEKIDLVKEGKEKELIADLKERTNLDIIRVEVGHIDFLRDVAYVKVYYHSKSNQINTIDRMVRYKDFTR
ncbi:MAG: DUF4956 domain-containing protein [Bacteroidales bacterium]|nr:DUF4956 domain-containing protein [Bacteroidales bacterium]